MRWFARCCVKTGMRIFGRILGGWYPTLFQVAKYTAQRLLQWLHEQQKFSAVLLSDKPCFASTSSVELQCLDFANHSPRYQLQMLQHWR